jgi:DNA-binding CsgD family transcriptional regulator
VKAVRELVGQVRLLYTREHPVFARDEGVFRRALSRSVPVARRREAGLAAAGEHEEATSAVRTGPGASAVDATTRLERVVVVGIDIVTYGRRSPEQQVQTSSEVDELVRGAAAEAEVGFDTVQYSGDGMLAVLRAGTHPTLVLGVFVTELRRRLAVENEDRPAGLRTQLRLAVAVVAVTARRTDLAGPTALEVGRLLDSRALREASRGGDEDLVVIFSEEVLRTAGMRPDNFEEVHVDLSSKGTSATAYVQRATSPGLAGPVGMLSPREREIALLAAAGRTDREISEVLALSPRTVRWHLTHVYRKLEIHRRRDLVDLIDVEGGDRSGPPPAGT